MSKTQKYIVFGIATLALIVALSVAIKSKVIPLGEIPGATNYSTIAVDKEVAFVNASTTNVTFQQASSTSYMKVQSLYIGSGQYMDSFYNDTGYPLYAFQSLQGYDTGTASSSVRMSVFATTTGPSLIKQLFTYTALSTDINGANSFLSRNNILATSTTATTTSSSMLSNLSKGDGMIIIPKAGYLHFLVQQGDLMASCSVNKSCESATSTARGIGDYFATFVYTRVDR